MRFNFLLVLFQTVVLCNCQSLSYDISRHESGDEVSSLLTTTAAYCAAIRAYPDGSQCKCYLHLTFSLDLQICIDYYNGKNKAGQPVN